MFVKLVTVILLIVTASKSEEHNRGNTHSSSLILNPYAASITEESKESPLNPQIIFDRFNENYPTIIFPSGVSSSSYIINEEDPVKSDFFGSNITETSEEEDSLPLQSPSEPERDSQSNNTDKFEDNVISLIDRFNFGENEVSIKNTTSNTASVTLATEAPQKSDKSDTLESDFSELSLGEISEILPEHYQLDRSSNHTLINMLTSVNPDDGVVEISSEFEESSKNADFDSVEADLTLKSNPTGSSNDALIPPYNKSAIEDQLLAIITANALAANIINSDDIKDDSQSDDSTNESIFVVTPTTFESKTYEPVEIVTPIYPKSDQQNLSYSLYLSSESQLPISNSSQFLFSSNNSLLAKPATSNIFLENLFNRLHIHMPFFSNQAAKDDLNYPNKQNIFSLGPNSNDFLSNRFQEIENTSFSNSYFSSDSTNSGNTVSSQISVSTSSDNKLKPLTFIAESTLINGELKNKYVETNGEQVNSSNLSDQKISNRENEESPINLLKILVNNSNIFNSNTSQNSIINITTSTPSSSHLTNSDKLFPDLNITFDDDILIIEDFKLQNSFNDSDSSTRASLDKPQFSIRNSSSKSTVDQLLPDFPSKNDSLSIDSSLTKLSSNNASSNTPNVLEMLSSEPDHNNENNEQLTTDIKSSVFINNSDYELDKTYTKGLNKSSKIFLELNSTSESNKLANLSSAQPGTIDPDINFNVTINNTSIDEIDLEDAFFSELNLTIESSADIKSHREGLKDGLVNRYLANNTATNTSNVLPRFQVSLLNSSTDKLEVINMSINNIKNIIQTITLTKNNQQIDNSPDDIDLAEFVLTSRSDTNEDDTKLNANVSLNQKGLEILEISDDEVTPDESSVLPLKKRNLPTVLEQDNKNSISVEKNQNLFKNQNFANQDYLFKMTLPLKSYRKYRRLPFRTFPTRILRPNLFSIKTRSKKARKIDNNGINTRIIREDTLNDKHIISHDGKFTDGSFGRTAIASGNALSGDATSATAESPGSEVPNGPNYQEFYSRYYIPGRFYQIQNPSLENPSTFQIFLI